MLYHRNWVQAVSYLVAKDENRVGRKVSIYRSYEYEKHKKLSTTAFKVKYCKLVMIVE